MKAFGASALADSLQALQQRIAYQFADPALLERALSHRSTGAGNNERLEFLGDSVLNHIIAEHLYRRFPRAREGALSRMRATLVNGHRLAAAARALDLGCCVRLGPGEKKSGGHRRESILADVLEALAGAILLDGGMEPCRRFVELALAEPLAHLDDSSPQKDAKSKLQEYLQGRGRPLPHYELVEVQGLEHEQQFRVLCRVQHPACQAEGIAASRRSAEQHAAAAVLEQLQRGTS